MLENNKVSVIVAIYNIEKYIGKCIQSIIDQDYKNLEIILVNDYSKDSSGKICDEYAKKDERIIVIHHKENTRVSKVRNDGLDRATGDYVVFVDGDDWLAPDFVSYMLGVITETKADMAINLVNFTTIDTTQVEYSKPEIWSNEKATAEFLFPHLTIGCWNKIYRRDFIEKNNLRFKDLFTAEGDRFVSDALQRANHVGVGKRKVYYYRLNNTNSATTKYDIRQSIGAIEVVNEMKKDLLIRTPYVISAIDQHIWLNHFWNVRQILALKLKNEKHDAYDAYIESLNYIKKHAFNVAKEEKRLNKKIKYYFTGLFPILAAKTKNFIFDLTLRRDVKHYKNIEKED